MSVDIQRLQTENAKSIEVLDNSITRLSDLMDDGLPLSQAIAVNAQLSRAQGDKIHLLIVRGHLLAAETIVSEIDPAVEARLEVLAKRLDDAIRDDFKFQATLDLIRVALSAAEEIADITNSHVS